jgi:hypothetical protein
MKKIKLTQGLSAQVDDSDYPWLNVWKWCAVKGKYTYYAVRSKPGERHKLLWMHRLIMNTPDDQEVDHQDHNGLNCQRHNMRNATHSENKKNVTPFGRSKYLGVSYHGKRIQASININGKPTHLGYFKTEEAAARRYDEMAKLHHGEFANLNFKESLLNKGEA